MQVQEDVSAAICRKLGDGTEQAAQFMGNFKDFKKHRITAEAFVTYATAALGPDTSRELLPRMSLLLTKDRASQQALRQALAFDSRGTADAEAARAETRGVKAQLEAAQAELQAAKAEISAAKAEAEAVKAEMEVYKAEIQEELTQATQRAANAETEMAAAKAEASVAKAETEAARATTAAVKAEATLTPQEQVDQLTDQQVQENLTGYAAVCQCSCVLFASAAVYCLPVYCLPVQQCTVCQCSSVCCLPVQQCTVCQCSNVLFASHVVVPRVSREVCLYHRMPVFTVNTRSRCCPPPAVHFSVPALRASTCLHVSSG